jgi:hypothetical protein
MQKSSKTHLLFERVPTNVFFYNNPLVAKLASFVMTMGIHFAIIIF